MFERLAYAFNAVLGKPAGCWEEERYRFFRALKKDDTDQVSQIAAKYPQCISWSTPRGPGLAVALHSGSLNAFRALIALGADVDVDCKSGSLLHMAVKQGKKDFAQALIDGKASLDKWDHKLNHGRFPNTIDLTPLGVAIRRKDKEMIALLMRGGANLKAPCYKFKTLAFSQPASHCDALGYALMTKRNELADYMVAVASAPPPPAHASPAAPAPVPFALRIPIKVNAPLRLKTKPAVPATP